jgi:hypothetical protein
VLTLRAPEDDLHRSTAFASPEIEATLGSITIGCRCYSSPRFSASMANVAARAVSAM